MTVYCATSNAGKLREFRSSAGGIDIQALPGLAEIPAPAETGATFEENATQKAAHYGSRCDGYLFAEDSGLEVDALGGDPGVYSARFAGAGASDEANNTLLLDRLAGSAHRAARFVCVIALVHRGELLHTFRGEVEGQIALEARGSSGFGYDPLFHYPPFGCTFGEVENHRKRTVSHRGRALAQMTSWLQEHVL